MRVLLVEDDAGDAQLVEEYLSDAQLSDVELVRTTQLEETLTALSSERADAVLLDLQLPDSSGLNTINRVHRHDPNVAIIVLTGDTSDDLEHQAIAFGAQEYIPKGRLDGQVLDRALRYAVARARQNENMRAVVESSADGIVVVGALGIIRYVNRAAENLLGRSRDVLIGELFGMAVSTGEVEIVRPDASPRWAELKVTDVEWNQQRAFLVSLRDVTDRKRAEELQRRLQRADRLAAIGQLAAGVAHEVNNPATYVLTNLDELEQGVDEMRKLSQRATSVRMGDGRELAANEVLSEVRLSELLDLLDEAREGVTRVVHIVRELRTFARVAPDEVRMVDVNAILRSTCKMTAHHVRYRARLLSEFGDLPLLPADASKLGQVFANLVINAAQAIEEGSPERNLVRVGSRVTMDEIVVQVEDTGAGISEEARRRAFEPFFTTKPRGVGTGLGLSVCAEIVQRHGGEIEIGPRAGGGTRVSVRLPLRSPLADQVVEHQLIRPTVTSVHARVLVVDDEPGVLTAFQRALGRRHDLTTLQDARAALALLQRDRDFDVIVCDGMLPGCDAVRFWHAVHDIDERLASRIVFCSAGTFTGAVRKFLGRIDNPCLQKPFSWAALEETIHRLRWRRRPERARA